MGHALIIGGGIAGTLTAIALRQIGWSATLYEAHAAPDANVGAWLTVAVNGLDALRTLGLYDAVTARGFPSQTIELFSGSGKRLGAVPIGGQLADGTMTHTMKRADLLGALAEGAKGRGVPIVYRQRLVAAEPASASDGGGVCARFADGSTARGDLLVGADGIHSQTRTLIDPGAPGPRYVGVGNVGGFTPAGAVRLPPLTYGMLFGKRGFFGWVVSPTGETWWFANPARRQPYERAELAAMTSETWRAQLVALFADDRSPAAELVRATQSPLVGANQYDLPRVPTWRRGPLVLVGDAAHAASASSGQGASMAAEDAVTLALCLRDHGASGHEPALARFEALRRPRVERVVRYGARMGGSKTVGPIGRVARDLMMPLILRQLARSSSRSLAWLFDHHIDWQPASSGQPER